MPGETMNHPIALTLRLREFRDDRYAFDVDVTSRALVPLVLPHLQATDLRFRRLADGSEAGWWSAVFTSSTGSCLLLRPGETAASRLHAPVRGPEDRPGRRWVTDWVELGQAEYDVQYCLRVDTDYFDPDSHWRLPQLQLKAREAGAEVWMGEAVSNVVRIVYSV